MKSANQVREYVRRRCLQESEDYINHKFRHSRVRELAFIEVLNAFDTPHKTKLEMPKEPKCEEFFSRK